MRERFSSAPAMPKASAIPPLRSPMAPRGRDRVVAIGRGQNMGDSTPGPVRRGVVAGHAGVGTPDAVAVTPGVDESRVALAERIGVQAEATKGIGSEAGQKDVGIGEKLVEHPLAVVAPQVESDRALASVGQSHREVYPPAVGSDALGGETPIGVTVEAIDADDVGTPVGQEGARNRNEDPLGQLYDAYAVECPFIHRWLASTRPRGCRDLFVSVYTS